MKHGDAFPPVESLLTHRGDMLLIERLLGADAQSVRVLARADPEAWYAQADGSMPAWVGIELMAQAIAAWAGLQGWRRGAPPRLGFLLGTRGYTCRQPAFPAGSALEVTASEAFREDNGLAVFDCRIEIAGETVAEAALKVFEPTDFKAFMEQQT